MSVALLRLCCFLLMLHVESVLSVCDMSVRTLDFGCHLNWKCPDANSNTTYTVQSKEQGSWKNVPGCIQIARHSCDLSNVFTNLNIYNYIRLSSEHPDWMNETLCDPNDEFATFSPPSVNISMEDGSLWVTVNFPCAPSMSCGFDEVETLCPCPISIFTSLSATVLLYNKHKPSDTQIRSAEVQDKAFTEEFGFFILGEEYCAVANFTSKDPLFRIASPTSRPQCIYIPAKIGMLSKSLIGVVVCAVLITLGLAVFLLWRHCASPEPPLPKSLALLYDQEIQNATFIDFGKTASDHRNSESDRISVVSFSVFTHMDNQSYYHSSPSLGNGYYRSPILHDPGYTEESSVGLTVESGSLKTDGTHCFELLQTTHLIFGQEKCPWMDEFDETLKIPLSSVRVKCTEQEETTIEGLEHYRDVTDNMQEEHVINLKLNL